MTNDSTSTHTQPEASLSVCVIGFDYEPAKGKHRRFEPGDTVAGLPVGVMNRLANDGVIEPVSGEPKAGEDA